MGSDLPRVTALPTQRKLFVGHTPSSIFWSILGIILSGLVGGIAGWFVITSLGWDGVAGALVAAAIAMVVATGVWTAITVLLRSLGIVR
jgi:hypothetical protein